MPFQKALTSGGVCVGGHVLQLFVCTGSNPIKEDLWSGSHGEGGDGHAKVFILCNAQCPSPTTNLGIVILIKTNNTIWVP